MIYRGGCVRMPASVNDLLRRLLGQLPTAGCPATNNRGGQPETNLRPNSLAGPNSPYPTSRPASLIGRLIVISRNLSDDKVSNRSKLIEGPYRAPSYDKDD